MESANQEDIAKLGEAIAGLELPPNVSYSVAIKALRHMVGVCARLWRRNNQIEAGTERGGVKYVLGVGPDYGSALKHAAMTVAQAIQAMEKAKNGAVGSELVAGPDEAKEASGVQAQQVGPADAPA